MTWLRVDDTSLTHPKVMHLRSLDKANEGLAEHVVGFVMLAATWSGQHTTDCVIPCSVGLFASPHHWRRLSAAAVKVGMLSRPKKTPDGQQAWTVSINDGLFHLLSKDELDARKEHRKTSRQVLIRCQTLMRDGDLCRYCGKPVNPHDKRGNMKRHFEHVYPDEPLTDLVISCEACNQHKAKRDPDEAGMVLLDPPTVPAGQLHPYLHPDSILYITKHAPHLLRPDNQPDPAAPRPDNQPDHAPTAPLPPRQPPVQPPGTGTTARAPTPPPGPGPDPTRTRPETRTTDYARPGSAGTGRDGTGQVGTGGPALPQPQTRRSRARRGRTQPPPDRKDR